MERKMSGRLEDFSIAGGPLATNEDGNLDLTNLEFAIKSKERQNLKIEQDRYGFTVYRR